MQRPKKMVCLWWFLFWALRKIQFNMQNNFINPLIKHIAVRFLNTCVATRSNVKDLWTDLVRVNCRCGYHPYHVIYGDLFHVPSQNVYTPTSRMAFPIWKMQIKQHFICRFVFYVCFLSHSTTNWFVCHWAHKCNFQKAGLYVDIQSCVFRGMTQFY